MPARPLRAFDALAWSALVALAAAAGCRHAPQAGAPALPRELVKTTLPEHVIEPPDLLQINALQLIPKPPYRVQALDTLLVRVPNALMIAPIDGPYTVDPDGTLNLGPTYGTVEVVRLTLDEAKAAVAKKLAAQINAPEVAVSVLQSRGDQQVAGEHLVRADGTVYLGVYGSVPVAGLTLTQARQRVEERLAEFFLEPQVTVDVLSYNSKYYYVIFDGAGVGQQVYRLPITGNETVLDAISQVNGLGPVSDKHRLWVARPAPAEAGCDQILPVDWVGISTRGRTATNYQLLHGDRLYVKARPMVVADNTIALLTAPFERLFGFTLLGAGVVQQLQSFPSRGGNNGGFGGF